MLRPTPIRPSLLRRATVAITATAGALALVPAAADAAVARCEASAVRGSLLGAAPIEPVTANRGGSPCVSASGGGAGVLPAPLAASAIVAQTRAEAPAGRPDLERGIAVGGLASLRVSALPDLGIALPVDTVLDGVEPLTLPLTGLLQLALGPSISLDLRPALEALLPGGGLPAVDLVTADAAIAIAAARCVNGRPEVATTAQVAGLRVLGQEIVPGQTVTDTVNLIDTASIDPSDIDISLIQLPLLGGGLAPLLQGLIQPALDLLPDIVIPATVANVNVTAGGRSEADGLVTQQALRVQASVLGQPIADVVVGEASASAAGLDCTPPAAPPAPTPVTPSATDLALECTTRRLVLQDVTVRDGRVRLLGAADKVLAGKTVSIRFLATGKVAATAKVRPDGSFSASAPLPSRRIRSSNRARYRASIGRETSLDLKLQRRMGLTGVSVRGGRVTIAGRITRPLATPAATITLQRRVSCKKLETVKRFKPRRDGTFRVTVDAPEGAAVVYRLGTRVRKTTRNRKTFPTFTLPRAVDLG